MNPEVARENMVEQQIRPWNVLEIRTLNALREVRREDFVPPPHRDLAFADTRIPIGQGEYMLEPRLAARLLESLHVAPQHRLLLIGAGTGYTAALAASLCARVTALEIDPVLHGQAGDNLEQAGFDNVELVRADCFDYCRRLPNADNLFDRVLVTGSVPTLDGMFDVMVHERGCIVGIEGFEPIMQAVAIGGGGKRSLFDTQAPRLRNVIESPAFEF